MNGVERLLSLALTLSATSRGLTREELLTLVPAYRDGSPASRRRQFVRDLTRLNALGYQVITSPDPVLASTPRYRIEPGSQEHTTLNTTEEERAVLAAASTMWHTERGTGLLARVKAKLVAAGIPVNTTGLVGHTGTAFAMEPFLKAVADARAVSFTYCKDPTMQSEERLIEPWKVAVVEGRAYVLGFDVSRSAPRLFRMSRIMSTPKDAGPARAPRDASVDIAAHVSTAESLGMDGSLTVHAEPYKALRLRALCQANPAAADWEVPPHLHRQVFHEALRNAPWVTLCGSSTAAVEFSRICARIAASHTGAPQHSARSLKALPSVEVKKPRTVTSGKDQAARLSAQVAYVYARKSADLAQMAEDFGLSVSELTHDLQTLYYSADYSDGYGNLVDVVIDDGVVSIDGAENLIHPFTLTPTEASALLLALEALDVVPGVFSAHAIEGARQLLTQVLQAEGAENDERGNRPASADEADTEQEHESALVDAWRQGRTVRLMYSTPTRTGVSVRDVEPHHLSSRYGTLYLTGLCHLSNSIREFRADRIVGQWDPQDPSAPDPGDFTTPSRMSALEGSGILIAVRRAPWVFEAFNITRIYRDEEDPSREQRSYARVNTPAAHAVISAVFETEGAVEILEPARIRETVRAIAEDHIAQRGE